MRISERQNQLLELLKIKKYITVSELSQKLYTSQSSIRRDLTYLQNCGLLCRTHGGAAISEPILGVAGFYERRSKNSALKREIAKKASVFLSDGQTILLCSSSSAAYMLPHIAKLSHAKVFTNNIFTAMRSIESGIETVCIGGRSAAGSVVLTGPETIETIMSLNFDILFFSSQCIDSSGCISDSTEDENHIRTLMMRQSDVSVFLCDSSKFSSHATYKLCNVNDVSAAVFDKPYSELNTNTAIIL